MLRAPRLLGVVAALAASGLAISACAPVHAGAAATVGNQRITVTQVKAAADTMLKDKGTQASASSNADLQRQVLARLITNKLVADAAKQKGVSVSEGDVQTTLSQAISQSGGKDQLNQAAAAQGIAANDVHDYIYYALLRQKLDDELTKDVKIDYVDLAVIALSDKNTADQVLAQVKSDPSQFAAVAKAKSLDTNTKDKGGEIGQIPVSNLPDPLKTDIASKSDGDIFQEQIQGAYYIILLKSHTSKSLSDASGSQEAQTAQQQAFQTYMASFSKQEGVSVSPRYGSWDAASLQITPGSGALSSPESSNAPAPSGAPLSPAAPSPSSGG